MKPFLLTIIVALATGASAAFAQTDATPSARAPAMASPSASAPSMAPPIAYPTVAAALKALEAQDGDGTIVMHSEGWVIVNEPAAAAQWSFTPKDNEAYPAVVRRIIRHLPSGDVAVDTSSICEASAEACARLLKEFDAMNERVRESRRARMPRPVPPQ